MKDRTSYRTLEEAFGEGAELYFEPETPRATVFMRWFLAIAIPLAMGLISFVVQK